MAQSQEERWCRIEAIFNSALKLEPSRQTAFLAEACGTDSELRKEVQDLLLSSEQATNFLAQPIERAIQDLAGAENWVGQRIGPYLILRVLGEGGMGKVYLAERADQQYQAKVAFKTVGTFLGTQSRVLERFRVERQILANLQHPNIARLLDGGVTPAGWPYLVMDYVDGVPIDQYCQTRNLCLEERLLLFSKVCNAVEYAHHQLIVHRDLKPANILIDDKGEPKLLDFGIAKLVEQIPNSGLPGVTRATEFLMTPEYASPEQVTGKTISTATDVYGLGLLLYELLTGVVPFRRHVSSPFEIARLICEENPLPPSTVVDSNRTGLQMRKAAKDLDNVVLMALRKDPTERYGSVALLSADIQACLNGYPVIARQHNWRYRTAKFIGRHHFGVGAAIAAVLALICFSVAMGIVANRANREQQKAQKEAEFMASIFRAASPSEAKGHEITARNLLDRGAQRIEKELASQPDVRVPLLINMARAYSDLGAYDEGLTLLKRSFDDGSIRRVTPIEQAAALDTQATLYRLKSNYKAAEPLFRRGLALLKSHLGNTDPLIAQSLTDLGECLYLEQADLEAESLLRQALQMRRAEKPDEGVDVRNYLALLLERKGDFKGAAQLLSEAVAISRRMGGVDDPAYGQSLHNWASALIDVGDLTGAEKNLRALLTLRERVLGKTHPAIANTLNNLGFVLLEEGKPELAKPFLKQNLDLRLSVFGADNPETLSGWNNWGRYLHATGKYAEARDNYERALKLAIKESPEGWSVAQIEANLSRLAFNTGDLNKAEDLAKTALRIQRSLGGKDNPTVAASMLTLATIRLYQGDGPSAETLCRQALEIRAKKLAPENPALLTARLRLAEALLAEQKYLEAESYLKATAQYIHAPPFAIPTWQIAEAEGDYAYCERALGRYETIARRTRDSELENDPEPAFRRAPEARLREISERLSVHHALSPVSTLESGAPH